MFTITKWREWELRLTAKAEQCGEYVARDANDSWIGRGAVDRERSGMDLALYLFHAEEVVRASELADGSTVIILRRWSPESEDVGVAD